MADRWFSRRSGKISTCLLPCLLGLLFFACSGPGFSINNHISCNGADKCNSTSSSSNDSGRGAITGSHITTIQMGSGFDHNTSTVLGEAYTFPAGGEAWVVYTVVSPDANGKVELKLYNENTLFDTAGPNPVEQGTHVYANQITGLVSGQDKVEIYYNGTREASITFSAG